MRRIKMIASLGVNSRNSETMEKLIHAGVNVFLVNFSHEKLEFQGKVIDKIK